jgi:hypothetical protein
VVLKSFVGNSCRFPVPQGRQILAHRFSGG